MYIKAAYLINFDKQVQVVFLVKLGIAIFCSVVFFFCIVVPEFIITPTSVNATLGSTAIFNCSARIGVVGWKVNGSLLTELNLPDITANEVGGTFCLYVPAIEEYNNTVVVCSVTIYSGRQIAEDSGPAVLRIQGMSCTCQDATPSGG